MSSFAQRDYNQSLVRWLRSLADAVEAKRVTVTSFGKPVFQVSSKTAPEYQFQPDIRFRQDDAEAMRLFSTFPPGTDA